MSSKPTSQFWQHCEFQSNHYRKIKSRIKEKYSNPIYFEIPINEIEFRKWIRDTYKISYTEHMEVKISTSDKLNKKCLRSFQKLKIIRDQLETRKGKNSEDRQLTRQVKFIRKALDWC
jgi:hypothetical protein